jgi:hypothetical protein
MFCLKLQGHNQNATPPPCVLTPLRLCVCGVHATPAIDPCGRVAQLTGYWYSARVLLELWRGPFLRLQPVCVHFDLFGSCCRQKNRLFFLYSFGLRNKPTGPIYISFFPTVKNAAVINDTSRWRRPPCAPSIVSCMRSAVSHACPVRFPHVHA